MINHKKKKKSIV